MRKRKTSKNSSLPGKRKSDEMKHHQSPAPENLNEKAPETLNENLPVTQKDECPMKRKYAKSACKPDQTPLWKSTLEILTFLVAAVGLFVFWRQWQAASTANNIAAKNFQASQRAWVGPSNVEIPAPQPNKPLVWRVVYKNFGNSPAMYVSFRQTEEIFVSSSLNPTALTFLPLALPKATGKTITIFNGGTEVVTGGVPFTPIASQVDDVIHGRSLIVYIGEVSYQDIFGNPHTTKVCQVWNPLGAQSCGFGEEAN